MGWPWGLVWSQREKGKGFGETVTVGSRALGLRVPQADPAQLFLTSAPAVALL